MTAPATPAQLAEPMPFAALIGIEIDEATRELVRGRLDYAPERCTAGGVVHGGALMALADSCGALCAFLNLPDGATGTATIESHTHLMAAVRAGTVTATSRPLHLGRTIAVIETELRRHDGKLAAKTTQTQAFHHPPVASGRT